MFTVPPIKVPSWVIITPDCPINVTTDVTASHPPNLSLTEGEMSVGVGSLLVEVGSVDWQS